MNVDNPYKTPDSDVSDIKKGEITIDNCFPKVSAWMVFGLSLITIGIYPVYWLYTRSKKINLVVEKKISETLLYVFVGLFVVTTIYSFFNFKTELMLTLNLVATILYLVIYIIVLFSFRNRLADSILVNVSPVLTFFGTAIYLQYKINKHARRIY